MQRLRNIASPNDVIFPGWIDSPDAIELLESADFEDWQANALRSLIEDGFAVIEGATDPALCDAVVSDYEEYCRQNSAYVAQNMDDAGREKRLVNFHLWSANEMAAITNPEIMRLLDYVFAETACIYSTLTFKYGTQQPIHRDTPHFATWPFNRFCGVWTALEDVHHDAGPLMYIRGGHRYEIDQLRIFEEIQRGRVDLSVADQHALALDIYNGRVISQSPNHGELVVQPIKKGDVVIWHAETPHGGSQANDPSRSRWSVVAHCAPESIQVHQHDRFFSHVGPEAPQPRYGYGEAHGRKIAASGETAFM